MQAGAGRRVAQALGLPRRHSCRRLELPYFSGPAAAMLSRSGLPDVPVPFLYPELVRGERRRLRDRLPKHSVYCNVLKDA